MAPTLMETIVGGFVVLAGGWAVNHARVLATSAWKRRRAASRRKQLRPGMLTPTRELELLQVLRDFAPINPVAAISYSSRHQEPVAHALDELFIKGGWTTRVNNIPLEEQGSLPYVGTEVSGDNMNYVWRVMQALMNARFLPDLTARHEDIPLDLPPARANEIGRTLSIKLGHPKG